MLGPGTAPVCSQDGYLIHAPADISDQGLWAMPFSLDTLEKTGDAFPISTASVTSTVSRDGTLVYRDQAGNAAAETLVWRNRAGEIVETVGQPQPLAQPALSPDGQRADVRSAEGDSVDIWLYDLSSSTNTRLTFEDQFESNPAWSPSGREIVYGIIESPSRIVRRAADGKRILVVVDSATRAFQRPSYIPSKIGTKNSAAENNLTNREEGA